MKNRLGGVLFVRDGVELDYPFQQAIECLKEVCDVVCVVVSESKDQTLSIVRGIQGIDKIYCPESEWHALESIGKERLSYYTNLGIRHLSEIKACDYVFSLQADEILHEDSYDVLREIVEAGSSKYNEYQFLRFNMWGSPYTYLENPKNGNPCSVVVTRLIKTDGDWIGAYGDAESLGCKEPCTNHKSVPHLRIYHVGFIRDPYIHPGKIKHMQEQVFGMDSDKRLQGMVKFNPWAWHSPFDTEVIQEHLPKLIQKWAHLRNY
jgi:glycosyltransferase involved in cell wall biosynthesis